MSTLVRFLSLAAALACAGCGSAGSPGGAGTPPIVAPTGSPAPGPSAQPSTGPSSPQRFTTLPPGSTLPGDDACASAVRPAAENKRMNAAANATRGGQSIPASFFSGDDARAGSTIAPRIDGNFTGTTDEILQWAACKWGIDEDVARAQAVTESWWRQTAQGDWGTDPTRCPPGHGLGVDDPANHPAECPESWGILQNRYPYEVSAWPGIAVSTAFNADLTYGIWRACFEGYETWLNTVDRGSQYAAGDAWGCVGRWFAGRWHTSSADGYITTVQTNLSNRVWEQAVFQEP